MRLFWRDVLFDGWQGLARVLLIAPIAYAALVLIVRLAGKRALAKMSAFDLVVTVALGSTLATLILSKDVALAEGVLALAVLVGLQFLVAFLSVRSSHVRALVKSDPSLLVYRGRFLRRAMRAQRVTHDEVRAAMRARGVVSVEAVHAVVLETDGSLSVLCDGSGPRTALLPDVRLEPERTEPPAGELQPA